jgi:hypothetical protein
VIAATLARPAPGTWLPSGLPWKPYVYQGTGADTLTASMDEPESQFRDLPRTGRVLAEHGTDGAIRRHYRNKTPVCEACRQRESRRKADRAAADVASGKTVRAVHANRGDGRPRCGVWNINDPVIAAPGEEITCTRCDQVRGK